MMKAPQGAKNRTRIAKTGPLARRRGDERAVIWTVVVDVAVS